MVAFGDLKVASGDLAVSVLVDGSMKESEEDVPSFQHRTWPRVRGVPLN